MASNQGELIQRELKIFNWNVHSSEGEADSRKSAITNELRRKDWDLVFLQELTFDPNGDVAKSYIPNLENYRISHQAEKHLQIRNGIMYKKGILKKK